jgi:hypothetical protein
MAIVDGINTGLWTPSCPCMSPALPLPRNRGVLLTGYMVSVKGSQESSP